MTTNPERTLSDSPNDEVLSVQGAAAYAKVSVSFLNNLRSRGGGPAYSKLSAKIIRYRRADLDAWMLDRARSSTFDDRRPGAAQAGQH